MTEESSPHFIKAFSTHWIKYITVVSVANIFLVLGVSLLVVSLFITSQLLALCCFFIATIIILVSHHYMFHKLLSEDLYDIILTSDRIIYFNDCLFICDDEHEIPLNKITRVEVQQHGILQNVLDYGIIWFDTGGGTGIDLKRSIPYVPSPDKVAKQITKLIR